MMRVIAFSAAADEKIYRAFSVFVCDKFSLSHRISILPLASLPPPTTTTSSSSCLQQQQYSFLNTSPEHVGTALRASVYVKLVRLSRKPGFFDLIQRLRLEASSDYAENDKRFTGIYDIGSVEALGKSEVELINIMIKGVGVLIDLEKRLENGEDVDLTTVTVK